MTEKEALSRLQSSCSKQEKCIDDLYKKLDEWGISGEAAERTVKNLQKDGFVDNKRYASAFVKDKFRFNHWGRIKIVSQLRMKKIEESLITEALEEIDPEQYEEFVRNELTKKRRSLKDTDKYMLKSKLIRYGQSKGIEMEQLVKSADEIMNREPGKRE